MNLIRPPLPRERRLLALATGLLMAATPTAASLAAPLAYMDSTTLKVTYSPPWSTADLNRAVTTHDGFGLSVNWIETSSGGTGDGSSDDGGGGHHHGGRANPAAGGGGHSGHGMGNADQAELWSFVTYTRLLRRWNGSTSQANIWLDLGAGTVSSLVGTNPNLQEAALSAAVQIDAETQRLYGAISARTLQSSSASRNQASIKTGVALSAANYERIQPWIMVEVRGMQGTIMDVEVIPTLRLLHRRYVLELGASLQGHPHASLRYTF
ncbi:MAG: hypothetical protein KGO47_01040 [Cyanobacteria bacterium REEB417]|nr:hypothetical protein [Cyanobacteria bacterium REEB417]